MKLREILMISEKPRGWSYSSYYRLRSVSSRILNANNCDIEIDLSNMDSVLNMLNLEVRYKDGFIKSYNRTYKTYITEVKRYIKHILKKQKKWKLKKAA
jgi:hypothetical protein